eukprot:2223791-Amphidinium_carterae.4
MFLTVHCSPEVESVTPVSFIFESLLVRVLPQDALAKLDIIMAFGIASGSVSGMPFSDPVDLSGNGLSTMLRVEITTANLDDVLVSSSCTALQSMTKRS